MKKKEKPTEKTCYKCRKKKPIKDLTQLGVWVCNNCLNNKK
jgi:ribosomal protein L37AE/L43A